jgi:hypothetical protein
VWESTNGRGAKYGSESILPPVTLSTPVSLLELAGCRKFEWHKFLLLFSAASSRRHVTCTHSHASSLRTLLGTNKVTAKSKERATHGPSDLLRHAVCWRLTFKETTLERRGKELVFVFFAFT